MPMSLSIVVGPVFVIDGVPARTEKLAADPRPTVEVAAFAVRPAIAPIATTNAMLIIAMSALELFMDAPLHAHARRVAVSVSDGRLCGRPCHDRSVTHIHKTRARVMTKRSCS